MADPALRPLLSAVAAQVATQVAALGDRVTIDRTIEAWDVDDDGPYGEVSAATPATGALAGDGATLAYVTRVQIDLWERAGDEDPQIVTDTVAAVNGIAITHDGRTYRGRVLQAGRIPEPATDVTHSLVEVRYSLAR